MKELIFMVDAQGTSETKKSTNNIKLGDSRDSVLFLYIIFGMKEN